MIRRLCTLAAAAALALPMPDGPPADGPRPIDSARFAASGSDLRSFSREMTIRAPADEVWLAWTEADRFRAIYADEESPLAANIDLAIGGRFEWLFDGEVGSNGCQVLSYLPGRMLSFSWNAPPTQPESRERSTWVVVELEPVDATATRVRLTHLGFGEEPHWDETVAYFEGAWEHVLERFRAGLERD